MTTVLNFFQKVKTIVVNYGFRFKVKNVIGDYSFINFLVTNHGFINFKRKIIVTNYGFDDVIIKD